MLTTERGFGTSVNKTFRWNFMDIKYQILNSESDRLPLVFMPAPFMTTTREVFRPAISGMEN